jgi:NurA-like 5'-3' nuclease
MAAYLNSSQPGKTRKEQKHKHFHDKQHYFKVKLKNLNMYKCSMEQSFYHQVSLFENGNIFMFQFVELSSNFSKM